MNTEQSATRPVVLAAVAHPDDIEFMIAGTLLRLKDLGAEIHFWNLANGHCGTAHLSREEITSMRASEAVTSAKMAGGISHPPLFDDLGIFFDAPSLQRVAAVVRDIKPNIVLTQSPYDYMEDHQNTCRLIVTACFARSMRNFVTNPLRPLWNEPVTIYHALPHGLNDQLGRPVSPDIYTDITPTLDRKRAMLACHVSQKRWLDESQGMNAYLEEMDRMGAAVGKMSGKFDFAEGWLRHSSLGFCDANDNPLADLLGPACHVVR